MTVADIIPRLTQQNFQNLATSIEERYFVLTPNPLGLYRNVVAYLDAYRPVRVSREMLGLHNGDDLRYGGGGRDDVRALQEEGLVVVVDPGRDGEAEGGGRGRGWADEQEKQKEKGRIYCPNLDVVSLEIRARGGIIRDVWTSDVTHVILDGKLNPLLLCLQPPGQSDPHNPTSITPSSPLPTSRTHLTPTSHYDDYATDPESARQTALWERSMVMNKVVRAYPDRFERKPFVVCSEWVDKSLGSGGGAVLANEDEYRVRPGVEDVGEREFVERIKGMVGSAKVRVRKRE
ncbi:hypothetical protein HK102_007426 [Quaeritorhiza haematococci]|nr:hypothetical protein HK102_007426 [Quaeritorhiza haematococci]